jgi:small subunit ribosomal protein S13
VSNEFNYIVRLKGTNVDGSKKIPYALTDIKGIGIRFSNAVVKALKMNKKRLIGNLSSSDVKRIEEAIEEPVEAGLPAWVLNRRKDMNTGGDLHLSVSDLDLRVREDIERMKETRSWKGVRHSQGLKVRGQHTKTTARKERSIGVSRRRIRRQQAQKST